MPVVLCAVFNNLKPLVGGASLSETHKCLMSESQVLLITDFNLLISVDLHYILVVPRNGPCTQ